MISVEVKLFGSDSFKGNFFPSYEVQNCFKFFIHCKRFENQPSCFELGLKTPFVFTLHNRDFFKNNSCYALKKTMQKKTSANFESKTGHEYFLGMLTPYCSGNIIDLKFIPFKRMHLEFPDDLNQSSLMFPGERGGQFLIISEKQWMVKPC